MGVGPLSGKNIDMAARHHTVPRFYLRNFADISGHLALVSRDVPSRPLRVSVGNVAVETGFYRIEPEDLAREEDRARFDPEGVEAALSGLEAAIAPAIRSLVESGFDPSDHEVWYRLVQFAALQTVRGNRWRNDFAALATQSVRASLLGDLDEERVRSFLVGRGLPNGPGDVVAFVERLASSKFPAVVPPQAVLVQESLRMALGDPEGEEMGLGQFLAGKEIELIVANRAAVLTSDEPVCWWSPGNRPIGYATAQVVWVPLSPRLIVQFRDPAFDISAHGAPIEDPDKTVRMVNRLVASQAERWIIHHPEDVPLADLDLPPREVWGDEVLAVRDEDDVRRELRIHRRRYTK
ncbi:hypothetical protein M2152_000945 [Microbacteriaceae bacterium SG_E_30_P1]|uniref:DUF4238 domain-containing protein n=2 Tax=Antiquaquibacter oligotrophicus TaxID=2880260 RepID=A0ABT6KL83_9MICO|nr:hypothetical protein [Antiquaquibacter oligotrophicus]